MIVSIGEALIDFIQADDGTYSARPGGAPANTAITLARLGRPVQFAGRTSTFGFGPSIRERLRVNGVGLDLLVESREPATLAIASISESGSAAYSFYLSGTSDWQWTASELGRVEEVRPDALHFGSLAAALPPGAGEVEQLISRLYRANRSVISFDLNIRPAAGLDVERERIRVDRQLAVSHIVKASEEDLEWLYPSLDPAMASGRWARSGRFVVVTRGRDGAELILPDGSNIQVASLAVTVTDTIGAGDAFCGGLLAALDSAGALGAGHDGLAGLSHEEWTDALGSASAIAALTCTRPGAEPPTAPELEAFLSA